MATTVWSPSSPVTDGPAAGQETYSFREVITNNLSVASLGQVRVTFITGVSPLKLDHASIGVSSGANCTTTATPVELTFSAAHGFDITNTSIVSDWVNLSFTSGQNLVVVMDVGTTHGNMYSDVDTHSDVWFNGPSVASYNVASGAGFSDTGAQNRCINLIETQSGNTEFHRGPHNLDGMATLFSNPIG